eukprot:g10356.t1
MEVVCEPCLTFALGGAEKEFECGICMQLASDPVLTSCCGTTYCESCAGKLEYPIDYPAGARRCPICRKPMWTSKSRALRAVLENAPATCKACGATVSGATAEEHFAKLSGPASFLAWEAPYVRRIGRALSDLQVQDLVDIGVFVAHPRELYEKALSHFAVDRWKRLHNKTRKNGMEFDVAFPVTLPGGISLEKSLTQMKSLASDLNADRDLLARSSAPKNGCSVNIDKNGRAVIQNIARHFDNFSGRAPQDHGSRFGSHTRLLLGRMGGHILLARVLMPIVTDYVHEAAYRRAFIEHAGAKWPLEAPLADESTMLMRMPSAKLEERLLEAGRRTLGLADKELRDFVYTGRYDKCEQQNLSFYWAQATPTFCYTHTDHACISCMLEDFEDLTLWGHMFAKDDEQRSASSANANKRKNATDAGETTGGGGAGNGNRDGSQEIGAEADAVSNPSSKRARAGSS